MKRRLAYLPLHGGKAPPWLFKRMSRLAGAVTMAIVDAWGPAEMLRRLADPWWFQAFGCVLGFDWHSSGLTTVTCGALKEAQRRIGDDLGIHVAGGKGGVSRRTPREIAETADRLAISAGRRLIHASRMSAKVDSAAVQDGYQLYHHCFFYSAEGDWCVVQQGLGERSGYARRYHWLGESLEDFVCEPHHGIDDLGAAPPKADRTAAAAAEAAPGAPGFTLNMVAAEAGANRDHSAELARLHPDKLLGELARLTEGPTLFAPAAHRLPHSRVNLARLHRIAREVYERQPQDFATLLETQRVGPATVRGLSLLAELIYDAPASHRDPGGGAAPDAAAARRNWTDYAYAHGGKDGHPFPVDRDSYDRSIAVLTEAVRKARVGQMDRVEALRRLAHHASTRGVRI